jgi:glutathione synthase/RimK-type ligase-like ATP-grasp enzyme
MLHPWIRSYDGGWRINYVGFRSTDLMKKLALRAVKAFGLTFGAIDLASNPDGVLKVLEVNRAPGIEGSTIDAYVKAINKWIAGEEVE